MTSLLPTSENVETEVETVVDLQRSAEIPASEGAAVEIVGHRLLECLRDLIDGRSVGPCSSAVGEDKWFPEMQTDGLESSQKLLCSEVAKLLVLSI
jgi:hypothetical protein